MHSNYDIRYEVKEDERQDFGSLYDRRRLNRRGGRGHRTGDFEVERDCRRRPHQGRDRSEPLPAVIVGSGIRAGKVYKDTLAFLGNHQDSLSEMPVAYFVVCLTMQDDTEENRCEVETYVDQMRQKAPQVQPVGVGLFAGKLDYQDARLPYAMDS